MCFGQGVAIIRRKARFRVQGGASAATLRYTLRPGLGFRV